MKVALILALVVVGAFAQDEFKCTSTNKFVCTFQELWHKTKHHATTLGNNLSDVGSAVLSSALEQGKSLLANGAQAVLGTVLEHLNKSGALGKRETLSLADRLKGHVQKGVELAQKAKEFLQKSFQTAVSKLTGIVSNISGLKQIETDADKEIDGVVDEFNKAGKTGFGQLANAVVSKLKDVLAEGLAKIQKLTGVKGKEKRNILLNSWNAVKNVFSGASKAVADTFKPHLDQLSQSVKDLADKAKEHATTITAAAKASFQKLTENLTKQVETLKGHAQKLGPIATTAVDQLKIAVAKIATETLKNAVTGIGKRNILVNSWNAVKNAFAGASKALGDTFKPHLDQLQQGVQDLANKAKEHATTLTAAAKASFQKLADNLTKQVETFKGQAQKLGGHAVSAVEQLKAAVAQIASETLKKATTKN